MNIDQHKFVEELHNAVGVCCVCGKDSCPGKQALSNLPPTIPTHIVMQAMQKARIEETPCKQ
ncbi:hypothetical protein [Methylophilus sp. 3sh_L]|uniref:hypothetical protein n=1 Tax=Methylophilus sp. 3sh_L TaxID=3377114 RepID=UPI00398EB4A3